MNMGQYYYYALTESVTASIPIFTRLIIAFERFVEELLYRI